MVKEHNTKKEILAFAGIAFILLGVLFGMNIMTFIFGTLSPDAAGFSRSAGAITGELGFINSSIDNNPYNLTAGSNSNPSNFAIVTAINGTSGNLIEVGNYSVVAATGSVSNVTNITWLNVSFNYTFNFDGIVRAKAIAVQNNSLEGINTYANQSGTQLNIVSVVIILVLLIGIFIIFWRVFMGTSKGKNSAGGNFS